MYIDVFQWLKTSRETDFNAGSAHCYVCNEDYSLERFARIITHRQIVDRYYPPSVVLACPTYSFSSRLSSLTRKAIVFSYRSNAPWTPSSVSKPADLSNLLLRPLISSAMAKLVAISDGVDRHTLYTPMAALVMSTSSFVALLRKSSIIVLELSL